MPQAEVSAAQEYDKYYESESDSDYDSGLDEEMVFSKLYFIDLCSALSLLFLLSQIHFPVFDITLSQNDYSNCSIV